MRCSTCEMEITRVVYFYESEYGEDAFEIFKNENRSCLPFVYGPQDSIFPILTAGEHDIG